MDNNRDRRTEGNDILKDAIEESKKHREFFDFENETIVFKKAYKHGTSASKDDKAEMQHTAQIRGGAVVRPLKQSTPQSQPKPTPTKKAEPTAAVSPVKPTQSAVKSVSAGGNNTTTAASRQGTSVPIISRAPTAQSNSQQAAQAQNRRIVPTEGRNSPINKTSNISSQRQNVQTTAVSKNVPAVKPTSPVPKSTVPAPKPAVQTVNPAPPNQPKPAVATHKPVQVTADKSHSSERRTVSSTANGRVIKPSRPEQSKTFAASHYVRSENDDFEIDEATYTGGFGRRSRNERNSGGESASGAVISLVKAMVYIVFIIIVSVGLSVFVIDTANDVFKFVADDRIVGVTVPADATIDDIADLLYDVGAIKHKWAFRLWSKMKDPKAEFIPGDYEISTTLNYDYLRGAFKRSNIKTEVRITIPEGFTVDEIINRFVENGIGTKEGFVDVINNYEFDYPFLENLITREGRIYRLEGYLFPDTYYFYDDSSEVTVVKKLLDNFNRKFVSEYYARCAELGLSVDDAIILASMVEKETRYADELGNVSSVFHNRIKYSGSFPYLNSDATIMYAMAHDLGGRPDTMGGEDTEYDSLYNTYTYKGLPPGPICNPSLNAIKYALYPNDTDYFYFVSDSSGRTLFAKTEPEHLENVATVRGK